MCSITYSRCRNRATGPGPEHATDRTQTSDEDQRSSSSIKPQKQHWSAEEGEPEQISLLDP